MSSPPQITTLSFSFPLFSIRLFSPILPLTSLPHPHRHHVRLPQAHPRLYGPGTTPFHPLQIPLPTSTYTKKNPQVPIAPPLPFGPTARGGPLNHVTILPEQGSLRSEPGYPISVNAVFVSGSDFIRGDPLGTHVRLQVDALLRDGPTGAPIRLAYTGTIKTAGTGAGKVFAGAEDAGTTGFGDGCEFFLSFLLFFSPGPGFEGANGW